MPQKHLLGFVDIDTFVVSGYGDYEGKNFTSTDKLYLLSTKEIGFDIFKDTTKAETRLLDYYNANNNDNFRIKNSSWWLRSAFSRYPTYFSLVYTEGDDCLSNPNNIRGVSLAF